MSKSNYARHKKKCSPELQEQEPRSRRTACEYCGLQITTSNLARHKKKCRIRRQCLTRQKTFQVKSSNSFPGKDWLSTIFIISSISSPFMCPLSFPSFHIRCNSVFGTWSTYTPLPFLFLNFRFFFFLILAPGGTLTQLGPN